MAQGPAPLKLLRTRFSAMGGSNEIAVAEVESAVEVAAAMEAAAREVLRIEGKFSRYRSDGASIVHAINLAAGTGRWTSCDSETLALLAAAREFHRLSGGLFDITSGVLRRAWNFKEALLPATSELAPLLDLIGFDRIEFEQNAVRLPKAGMEIDLGGIGKEYAADRALAVLAGRGLRHSYVNLGGDIAAMGGRPDGLPWRFGVSDPRDSGQVIASIDIHSGGVVTSGDGEKFIEVQGRRYCHILSPRTGYPVECWRSVSVRGVSAMRAGALATIAMLKEQDAVDFLAAQRCHYLLVDGTGKVVSTGRRKERSD
jgi:thiamine biosynthesis lipoprotein